MSFTILITGVSQKINNMIKIIITIMIMSH